MPSVWAKLLIAMRILLILAGVVLLLAPRAPWLGRLPGDIHIRGKGYSTYIPLATSILLSIILTILLDFLLRR